MTGFGEAEGSIGARRLRVEIRTVNHRFFNLSPRLPGDLAHLESAVRDAVRGWIDRGHVSLSVRWIEELTAEPALQVDQDRARVIVERLRELQRTHGLVGDVTVDLVARQPGVLTWGQDEAESPPPADVVAIVSEAAEACRADREREGAALAAVVRESLDRLEGLAGEIALLAPGRLVRERARLGEAVREALAGASPDPDRLALELAIQADRLDISEELVRLRTHVAAASDALTADGPIGKRLGFLAQELNREINTVGSKANDAAITALVIEAKGTLESMREQLENLE